MQPTTDAKSHTFVIGLNCRPTSQTSSEATPFMHRIYRLQELSTASKENTFPAQIGFSNCCCASPLYSKAIIIPTDTEKI